MTLKNIWQQAQTGDRQGARAAAMKLVKQSPHNVQGWLLLAQLLDDPQQKISCYRQVLARDADNPHALQALQRLTPASPPPPPQKAASPTSPPRPLHFNCPQCGAGVTPPSGRWGEGAQLTCQHCGTTLTLDRENARLVRRKPPASRELPTPFATESDPEEATAIERARRESELTAYAIKELGGHNSRNEIIRELCRRGGMDWPTAERFLGRVMVEHESDIAKRQGPWNLAISIGFIIAGLAILFAVSFQIIATLTDPSAANIEYTARFLPYIGTAVITGIGMVLGGSWGIYNFFKATKKI